ncbi:MAG: hypothetical protein H9W81_16045 [Enterococcus sp.]|nr:hypothetical protein [Enterococcus sp.]
MTAHSNDDDDTQHARNEESLPADHVDRGVYCIRKLATPASPKRIYSS